MVERSNSITANAHGLILSESAAGIIIQKNFNLCQTLVSLKVVLPVKSVLVHDQEPVALSLSSKYLMIVVSPLI